MTNDMVFDKFVDVIAIRASFDQTDIWEFTI